MPAPPPVHRRVRISSGTHRIVKQMASHDGVTVTETINRAVTHYYREHIFAEVAKAWDTNGADLMAEYHALEGTIADGLSGNEWWMNVS